MIVVLKKLKKIREIYPNFNIGISTGIKGDLSNNWKHPYRHWNFKTRDNTFDSTLTKRQSKNSVHPT